MIDPTEIKSTTLQKWLTPKAMVTFALFLEDRRRNYWSPDSQGSYHSIKISTDSLEHLLRGHELYRVRQLDLENFDVESCFKALERLSQRRRGGRVSPFDEKSLKVLIMVRRFANLPVDEHQKLLKTISRRATVRSKPMIKQRATEFRLLLMAYCFDEQTTKSSRAYEEQRDKAMILLMLTCSPLRVNSIKLLTRTSCVGNAITVEANEMKTRESISFEMPEGTARVMSRYMETLSPSSKWLFSTKSGAAMTRNAIYKTVRRRCDKILGVKLGTHSFRAIMATIVSKNIGQEFASSLLVINISTLRNYYDLSDSSEKLSAVILKIEDLK